MLRTLVVLALMTAFTQAQAEAPVCRIGGSTLSWTGSPADLAAIQATWEAEQAQAAGRAFPLGSPQVSPWTGLVRCAEGGGA